MTITQWTHKRDHARTFNNCTHFQQLVLQSRILKIGLVLFR